MQKIFMNESKIILKIEKEDKQKLQKIAKEKGTNLSNLLRTLIETNILTLKK